MKSLVKLFLLCMIVFPASAQTVVGTWMPQLDVPVPRGLRHDDIEYATKDIGWVVNTSGLVYKTVDGGTSWSGQVNNSGLTFRSAAFIDQNVGFIGLVQSEPVVLYETRDGGLHWDDASSKITGPTVQGICGMQAVTDSMVVGVGAFWGAPRFIISENGGESWTSTDMSAYAKTLVDVHFFNDSTGIAVGGNNDLLLGQAVVIRTEDRGATWEVVHTTSKWDTVDGEWGWKISTPSDSINYISVEYNTNETAPAKILKSDDQGQSWVAIPITGSIDASGLQGIGFLTDSTGWVGGRGTTSVTHDAGDTWTQLESFHPSIRPDGVLDANLNRIFVLEDSVAYAVGRYVYRFVPAEPVAIEPFEKPAPSFTIEQNYPNPFNPSTTIAYVLHRPQNVRLRLYGPTGRLVRTLVDNQAETTGRHEVDWDGTDSDGGKVASGIYFYTIDIGESVEMKKMILVK